MAEAIDKGKILYVGVWDMKQPGIFWFFWMVGKLFGFTTLASSCSNSPGCSALAGVMSIRLRRYFAHPWFGGVAAVAALTSYYMLLSLFLVLPAMGAIVFEFGAQALNFYHMVFSGERTGLEGYRRAVGVSYGW